MEYHKFVLIVNSLEKIYRNIWNNQMHTQNNRVSDASWNCHIRLLKQLQTAKDFRIQGLEIGQLQFGGSIEPSNIGLAKLQNIWWNPHARHDLGTEVYGQYLFILLLHPYICKSGTTLVLCGRFFSISAIDDL